MQGPDVGIGTTVEDVEELPPRSAARRRRRFRAALASVPRGSMPPQPPRSAARRLRRFRTAVASVPRGSMPTQPPRTNTRRRRSSCAPQATSAPRSLPPPPPPRCCASAARVRHAPSRSRCRGDLNRGIGGGFGEGARGYWGRARPRWAKRVWCGGGWAGWVAGWMLGVECYSTPRV